MFARLLILFFASLNLTIGAPDYYWDTYEGVLAEDALVGAENVGYNTYIGHAPYSSLGLLPGEIFSGVPTINITGWPGGLVLELKTYVQILCSQNPDNFRWINANYTTVNSVEGIVRGGYQTSPAGVGTVYIGRALVNSTYKIGRVPGLYQDADSYLNKLYVDLYGQQLEIDNYEVLAYIMS